MVKNEFTYTFLVTVDVSNDDAVTGLHIERELMYPNGFEQDVRIFSSDQPNDKFSSKDHHSWRVKLLKTVLCSGTTTERYIKLIVLFEGASSFDTIRCSPQDLVRGKEVSGFKGLSRPFNRGHITVQLISELKQTSYDSTERD